MAVNKIIKFKISIHYQHSELYFIQMFSFFSLFKNHYFSYCVINVYYSVNLLGDFYTAIYDFDSRGGVFAVNLQCMTM